MAHPEFAVHRREGILVSLSTTALHTIHTDLGARFVEFAGWQLPVQFAGIIAEHQHTRSAVSLFDVSHMGQVLLRPVSGDLSDAAAALESVTPASVIGLAPWRQRYALLTSASGGVIDDFMFAHHGDRYFAVVNAARVEEDLAVLRSLPGVEVELLANRSLLALQGPKAEAALLSLVASVGEYSFLDSRVVLWDNTELWISRAGYTGEDGFEISVPNERAEDLARTLLAAEDVLPAGLGARDSLRLEAGLPLYGHELSEQISPVEAGLSWSIPKVRRLGGSRAGGFPAAELILRELIEGTARRRVGLRVDGRVPVREGAPVFLDATAADPVSVITSGGFAPTVGGPVAMAMLPTGTSPGSTVYAQVRGKRLPLIVTELPFVQPNYKR